MAPPGPGRRLAWASFGAALALSALLAPLVGLRPLPFVPCLLVAAGLLAAAVLAYRRAPSPASLQRGWSLLAPVAGLLAVGWLASLP